MGRRIKLASVMVALGVVLSYAATSAAQGPPMVGGYRQVATNTTDVVAAARFAAQERGQQTGSTISLASIERAERQTVQGANYRLCLRVEVSDEEGNAETQDVSVVVYQNLKREYLLRSWNQANCG